MLHLSVRRLDGQQINHQMYLNLDMICYYYYLVTKNPYVMYILPFKFGMFPTFLLLKEINTVKKCSRPSSPLKSIKKLEIQIHVQQRYVHTITGGISKYMQMNFFIP